MKTKSKLLLLIVILFGILNVNAQDQVGSSRSLNQPQPQEIGKETYNEGGRLFTPEQEAALKQAQTDGNTTEANRIIQEMESKVPQQNLFPSQYETNDDVPPSQVPVPFNPDWYNNDVTVYSGAVKYGNPYFRQIDMKMGKDGNMYVAFNRAPVSGTNGRIDVYRSSNGGATWVYCNGVVTSTAYYGTVSLLVELNNNSANYDSIRVFVFYTRSNGSNNDDATMNYVSFRRDGSAWHTAQIAVPPSGSEYSFATAASDGAFYGTSTWVGVFCTESNNALTTTNNFRYYRSVNWGSSWTGVTISASYDDFYPSAELRPASSFSSDSVWVAVERRLSSTQWEVRIIRTPWSPTASSNTYFVTSGGSGVKYEKPALTIKQNRSCDSAMFTVTKNGVPYYCPTVNGGGTWNTDYTLGNGSNKSFTWCASGTSGADPFMGMWVSNDGDSVGLRLGGRIGNLGTYVYKRNSFDASTSVAPTCMVYNPSAGVNRAAFSYAGFGPTNIYSNQELLVTAIDPVNSQIPDAYSLNQNYPNPFNPSTMIKFGVPEAGNVKLSVYDLLGREVAVVVNNQLKAGNYEVNFNASQLSAGVYFYKLASGNFVSTKKMILVK